MQVEEPWRPTSSGVGVSHCIVFCLISFSYVISLWGFLYEKIKVRSTFRNNYFTTHVVINTIAVVIVLILAFLNRL